MIRKSQDTLTWHTLLFAVTDSTAVREREKKEWNRVEAGIAKDTQGYHEDRRLIVREGGGGAVEPPRDCTNWDQLNHRGYRCRSISSVSQKTFDKKKRCCLVDVEDEWKTNTNIIISQIGPKARVHATKRSYASIA